MSRVDKPIWVDVTGWYGHGHGLAFSNPRKPTPVTRVDGCDVPPPEINSELEFTMLNHTTPLPLPQMRMWDDS